MQLCANSLVAAEHRIEGHIAGRLNDTSCKRLDSLLGELIDGHLSRFVWLRKIEPGKNSADINRLLDRLSFLQNLGLSPGILANIPPHRVARLKRQGERYFADGLSDLSDNRRLSILAVCAVEWQADIADAIIETHDRSLSVKLGAKPKGFVTRALMMRRQQFAKRYDLLQNWAAPCLKPKATKLNWNLRSSDNLGWEGLQNLVATAARLTDTMSADPLTHVTQGYNRFRRYAPRCCVFWIFMVPLLLRPCLKRHA